MGYASFVVGAAAVTAIGAVCFVTSPGRPQGGPVMPATPVADGAAGSRPAAPTQPPTQPPALPALPASVEKALDWLAGAQQPDGGWGAGSHANQQERDAHAVPTDPATTAVAAMALLRAGNTLERGAFAGALTRATGYLLRAVETAPADGPQITAQQGTQPQAKMGQNVDTALTAQFLARLLHDLGANAPLRDRVTAALDRCVAKIQSSQQLDGSQGGGTWAGVLQSAQGCTALELAQLAGRPVDDKKLAEARDYQRGLVGATPAATTAGGTGAGGIDTFAIGSVRTDAAAGIALYGLASNMRGVVAEAKAAEQMVEAAKQKGELPKDAEVGKETLQKLGVSPERAQDLVAAVAMNTVAKTRAFDEKVLDGFGNNGGEEFLSYQMKAEALVIDGGEQWGRWNTMMQERLAKVQNADGSWTGHHCITSPTFCTATAICCLTADRDVAWLQKATRLAAK